MKLLRTITLLILIIACLWLIGMVKIPSSKTTIYQPSASRMKDMFYSSYYDYGSGHIIDNEKLRVGGWGDEYWTLLQFDLLTSPEHADHVELRLQSYDEEGTSTPMEISAITSPWDETHGWYINLDTEFLTTVDAPPRSGLFTLDITDLYNAWQSGAQKNYGIVIKPLEVDHQFNTFYSSDNKDHPNQRPTLVITVK